MNPPNSPRQIPPATHDQPPAKVTILLKGGLGNQMFQYAAALALSKKLGSREPIIDTVYLDDRWPRAGFAYRKLDLDIFGIEGPLTPLSQLAKKISFPGGWLGLDLIGLKLKSFLGLTKIITEKNYFELFLGAAQHEPSSTSYFLNDYFQSDIFFKENEVALREAFKFKREAEPRVAELIKKIESEEAVSLHVRRGDYLNPRNSGTFVAQGAGYYERAAEAISEKIKNPTYYVFSDDDAWCKENLKFLGNKAIFVSGDKEVSGYKASGHLRLMSACKAHIIGNSTYSWWGAWLDEDSAITVAPKAWFHDESRNSEDLVPEAWVRV